MQTETEVSDPQLTACPKADEQQSTKILFYLSVMPLETDRSLWIRRIMGWLAPDTWCEQQESVPFIWNYDLSCVLVTAIFLKINTGFCLNKKKKKKLIQKKKQQKTKQLCFENTHTHKNYFIHTDFHTLDMTMCNNIPLFNTCKYILTDKEKKKHQERKET